MPETVLTRVRVNVCRDGANEGQTVEPFMNPWIALTAIGDKKDFRRKVQPTTVVALDLY